jgi:hypothetical protein
MANDTDNKPQRSGHSKTPLTRDEKAALKNFHVRKLLATAAAIETVRGPFDEAKAAHTAQFNQAKVDLGKDYTRKRLTRLMEKVKSRTRDLAKEEAERFEDHQDLGLPVFGAQLDLYDGKGDSLPQEAKDEIGWELEGYAVGRRGGPDTLPEGLPPRMDQPYLKGYHRGLEDAAAQFNKGERIAAERAAPAEDQDEDEGDEDEQDPAEAEAELKKAARRLKETGFMDTTAGADDQVAA